MRGKSHLIHIKRKTIIYFILIVVALAIATPVLADYLGPNRTVTETTSVCKVVLYECKYVAAKNQWKYKKVDDWSCSNEGKPWQGYDNYDGDCGPFSDGRTQWGQVETLQTVTTTQPEATISNSLLNCNLNNGWCNTVSELSLNGTEPLSGYSILTVEGSLNGQTFACSGDNCTVPLNEGSNDFSFWAISSWGDSSQMGIFSAKVDTVPPALGLDITATSGANGWYVSPTTITATGSDSTSGLSSVFLSVDGGIWVSSTILNEGVYNVFVQAEDNAGNIAQSPTTISIDTTTPTLDVSINGTMASNGWYSSSMEVIAVAGDATSGIASLEYSLDGGVYQAYTSPVAFADGYHTVQFKAVDKAGNDTETSVQEFYVDTIAPAIDLPAEWKVNGTITYKAQDDGSGLFALRVVIEDEDEKFAKVAWNEVVSGNKFKGEITWNGKFKDGTVAPPGEYLVWVKVTDLAGNERIGLGRVIVPSLFSLFPSSKSSTEIPTPPVDLFDPKNISPTTAIPSTAFGGSTTPPNSTSVQSLTLSSGTASASTTTTSNVLWGTTAAALIGWATATALDERKKRREQEQAQAAQVQTQVDAFNAAQETKRIAQTQQWKINSWLEGQTILDNRIEEAIKQGASETEVAKLKQTAATEGLSVAIEDADNKLQLLYTQNIAKQQTLDAFRAAERNDAAATAWQQQQGKQEVNTGGSKPLFMPLAQEPEDCGFLGYKCWGITKWATELLSPKTPTATTTPVLPTVSVLITHTPTPTTSVTNTPIPLRPVYPINGPLAVAQIPSEFKCTIPKTKPINGKERYGDYYYRCKVGEQLMEGLLTDPKGWWWYDGEGRNNTRWSGIKTVEDAWNLALTIGLDAEGVTLRVNDFDYAKNLRLAFRNKFWYLDHGALPSYENGEIIDYDSPPLGTNGRLLFLGSLEALQKRVDGPNGFVTTDKPASEVIQPPFDGYITNNWDTAYQAVKNIIWPEPAWKCPPANEPFDWANIYAKTPQGVIDAIMRGKIGTAQDELIYIHPNPLSMPEKEYRNYPDNQRVYVLTLEQKEYFYEHPILCIP